MGILNRLFDHNHFFFPTFLCLLLSPQLLMMPIDLFCWFMRAKYLAARRSWIIECDERVLGCFGESSWDNCRPVFFSLLLDSAAVGSLALTSLEPANQLNRFFSELEHYRILTFSFPAAHPIWSWADSFDHLHKLKLRLSAIVKTKAKREKLSILHLGWI